MTNKEFDNLIDKYDSGNCTNDEHAFILDWAAKLDEHKMDLDESVGNEIWNKIKTDSIPKKLLKKSINLLIVTSVAASLLIFFVYNFILVKTKSNDSRIVVTKGIETINKTSTSQKVTLPDGSSVYLSKSAKILVDEEFGKNNRTVFLTGEGFFKVTRNEKMPFLVHVGDLVTEVLGTSFKISQNSQKKLIEVSVKTGRVSVYSNEGILGKKKYGVILTPNQKAVYDIQSKTIQQSIVDSPNLLENINQKPNFHFEEKSIKSVLDSLSKNYGVDILIVNPAIENCVFTGDLNGLEMFMQIDLICKSINSIYEVRGSTIFINGKGCQ